MEKWGGGYSENDEHENGKSQRQRENVLNTCEYILHYSCPPNNAGSSLILTYS